MKNYPKKLAPKPVYVSPAQLTLEGFETPFAQHLNPENRWVILAKLIPWDEICGIYQKQMGIKLTGRKPINARVIIGAIIIKHICNLDDRETIDMVKENVYMQYFLGYPSFSNDAPFDASLFVTIRERLNLEILNIINEKIIAAKTRIVESNTIEPKSKTTRKKDEDEDSGDNLKKESQDQNPPGKPGIDEDDKQNTNKGRVIFDATACPQNISYPTDLDLLSSAREKSEELIDILYNVNLHKKKPRTYREKARKDYLHTAQKKQKTNKEIRKATKKQLQYLSRDIKSIDKLLDAYPIIPLNRAEYKYMLVIKTVYQQQLEMHDKKKHTIEDRIVSIHQPHVRPIVRGKAQSKVEFGSKIHISVIDGITFLDELSWNAFNEGKHIMQYVEQYFRRFNFYPKEILADKIYCTRENRKALKEKGIKLFSKPLGRSSAVADHVRPGERNPVEGKFGQAKTAYGLDCIRARLKVTSQSWIASIILVLNLVKLAGSVPLYLNINYKSLKLCNVFQYLLEINYMKKINPIRIKY